MSLTPKETTTEMAARDCRSKPKRLCSLRNTLIPFIRITIKLWQKCGGCTKKLPRLAKRSSRELDFRLYLYYICTVRTLGSEILDPLIGHSIPARVPPSKGG